jgi:hypothetical protein
MLIQINSDNSTAVTEAAVEGMTAQLDIALAARFEDRLTRVEVYFAEETAPHASERMIKCIIEARPRGQQPITVSAHAGDVEAALRGATHKAITALDTHFGKTSDRKGH